MTFVLALKAVGARPWRHAFCTRTKNRLQSKSVKNRAYSVFTQRIYASGGVFEPRAERACLVQLRAAVARSLQRARLACWRKESAAAAPCGERERAKARDGYAPTARCGTGLWRVTGRGAGLLDDSSADVGFSAGWLGADAALPGL